jgi:hypothetical protein
MSRGGRRRKEARLSERMIPVPNHPYRDSAIFYGILTGILVVVAYFTGGHLPRALLFGGGFFVVATGWSWFMFRRRLEREAEDRAETEAAATAGETGRSADP